ncbi:MAG: 6,7-dimethyl-8-ribityllumazine synthase [Burkholderiales bacterium]
MIEIKTDLSGRGIRVGVVRARFNEPIGLAELGACLLRLAELGVKGNDITVLSVPGALELPLTLQQLAATRKFDAFIALGAVIRGETYHFEIVSNESSAGITQVQLDTGIPIANGVLTTDTDAQAEVRAKVKGRDCADAAIEMANLVRNIAQSAK